MKSIIVGIILLLATSALATVLAISVSVDQDTKMFLGTDLTNYILVPSGTFEKTYIVEDKSQVVFSQTSSAKTTTSNLRLGFMNKKSYTKPSGQIDVALPKDIDGQKIQSYRIDSIGNYFLTKSTTIPLN